MRGDGLPSVLSPNERVGEPDDHVVGHACEIPRPVCAPGHDRGVAKKLNPHIVDLKAADSVHALREHVAEDAGPVSRAAVRPRASPFGSNDPLDCCPVAGYPGFSKILLDLCERCSIFFWPTILVRPGRRAQHGDENYEGKGQQQLRRWRGRGTRSRASPPDCLGAVSLGQRKRQVLRHLRHLRPRTSVSSPVEAQHLRQLTSRSCFAAGASAAAGSAGRPLSFVISVPMNPDAKYE